MQEHEPPPLTAEVIDALVAAFELGTVSTVDELAAFEPRGDPRRSGRRQPLASPRLLELRVRGTVADAPWRLLRVRSDISLSSLHEVLCKAFGLDVDRPHRCSIGSDPLDPAAECFLSAHELDGWGPQSQRADGADGRFVRLDEVLQRVGDELRYVHDLESPRHLVMQVEGVLEPGGERAEARAIDGAGGLVGGRE